MFFKSTHGKVKISSVSLKQLARIVHVHCTYIILNSADLLINLSLLYISLITQEVDVDDDDYDDDDTDMDNETIEGDDQV